LTSPIANEKSFGIANGGRVMASRPVNPFVESSVGDNLLVFDPTSDDVFAMNLSGKIVWKSCQASQDIMDSVDALCEAFGETDKVKIKTDVDAFLGELASYGLDRPRSGDKTVATATVSRLRRPYEPPNARRLAMEWVRENHPMAVIGPMFSDTWTPAGSG
jgi:hypothetical protein